MENEQILSSETDAKYVKPEECSLKIPIEDVSDENFNYDGYQVVRREFFAHVFEPSITFNNSKISLNTACLNRLPDVEYVQILVNPEEKKLVVRPCCEDDKDSFLWCTKSNTKRKVKYITCRVFFAKVVQLMEWNPDYRYKLLGKIIRTCDEYLLSFDLKETEIYQRILHGDDKLKTSCKPVYPVEWQNQFGLPIEEHRKLLQVNIFDGFTVFGIKDNSNELQQKQITLEDN